MTDTERSYGIRHTTGVPDRVSAPQSGWPMVLSGLLTALTTLAPWARIDKLHVTRTGLQEGPLLLGVGLLVAVCGGLVVVRRGSMRVLVVGMLAATVATVVVVLGLGSADIDISARFRATGPRDVAVQWGYYLELVLALVCVAAAVIAFLRRESVARS